MLFLRRKSIFIHTCLAGTTALGLIALFGRANANLFFSAFGDHLVPMATSTALALILLSCAVMISVRAPHSRVAYYWVKATAVLILAFAILVISQYLLGFNLGIERMMGVEHDMIFLQAWNEVVAVDNAMSPLTAGVFLLAGAAVLLSLPGLRSKRLVNLASILVICVLGASLVFLLGYAYQQPLQYTSDQRLPVAMPTALGLLLLGAAILALIGPKSLFFEQLSADSVRARLLTAFLPITLILTLAASLLNYYLGVSGAANPAVLTASITVMSLLIIGMIVWYIGYEIGGRMDRAEEEKHLAARALRESEAQQKAMIANIEDVIAVVDEQGTVRYVSPNIKKWFGWTIAEVVGSQAVAMVHDDDRLLLQDAFKNLLQRENASDRIEYRLKCKGGGYRIIEGTAVNLRHNSDIQGILVNYHDVTDRKRQERELQQLTETLERRVQERTAELRTFEYSVAHDLIAPNRHMVQISKILMEDYAGSLNQEAVRYLSIIIDSGQRQAEMIDSLLLLSRLTSAEITIEDINVSELAQQIVNQIRSEDHNREVSVTIQPDIQAAADRKLLMRLLENLISNAWKYTVNNPDPRIEVFCTESAEGSPVFAVRDNGAGFDENHAQRMFEPFYRLHRENEFKGNGVGLSIVKRIAERHGGTVWASGKTGHGAVFYFTLGQ